MSKKKSANPKSKDFDWLLFLSKPMEEVKQIDVQRAHRLSGDWPTCAYGQLCQLLPRSIRNEPEDNVLYDLGIEFNNIMAQYDDATYVYYANIELGLYKKKVANAKRKKALAIFNKIEKRAIKLLSKLNEQNIISK
jgi:hypothetical protein